MSREITVITPENVSVAYELSGIGSRFIALLIDTMVQTAGAALLAAGAAAYFILTSGLNAAQMLSYSASQRGWVIGAAIFGIFLLNWAYFIVFEAIWNGQTPGKKAVNIRVVREGGRPVDLTCSAIRNLMRYADFLPGFYTVGLLSIFFSPKYKRLGDYAAGTIVVKERSPKLAQKTLAEGRSPRTPVSAVELPPLDALSPDEIEAVSRFISRRSNLPLDVQLELAKKIALPLLAKLGMSEPPHGRSFAGFLEDIEAATRDGRRFQ